MIMKIGVPLLVSVKRAFSLSGQKFQFQTTLCSTDACRTSNDETVFLYG